jgi:hypothetical protein
LKLLFHLPLCKDPTGRALFGGDSAYCPVLSLLLRVTDLVGELPFEQVVIAPDDDQLALGLFGHDLLLVWATTLLPLAAAFTGST